MELYQLRYFLAVAESLNFRRGGGAVAHDRTAVEPAGAATGRELGVELFRAATDRCV